MSKRRSHIIVFEHESIRFDKGEKRISEDVFKSLQAYYGENGVPYFKLIDKGIKFNNYVGVIQVGDTLIEVLPKADKNSPTIAEEKKWRDILIEMLRAVGHFDIKSTSNSNLKIKPNTILDLYLELFIKEVEYLIHNGLIKSYRRKEGNTKTLKGSLHFSKNIQKNLTHKERFYVRHSIYDTNHKLHSIIYKTICLLKLINTNAFLHHRIGALILYFPELPDLKITDATFNKLTFRRKTLGYKKAIDLAKLLLLQYHPDIVKGRNNVLALMFDMNKLWEQFVYVSLRKNKESDMTITTQTSKYFWKPTNGYISKIRPDIIVNKNTNNCLVLDTKWKNLEGSNPSPDDLRQMYVYHEYYNARKVALVYPGPVNFKSTGFYLHPHASKEKSDKECSIMSFSVEARIKQWQINIYKEFRAWVVL